MDDNSLHVASSEQAISLSNDRVRKRTRRRLGAADDGGSKPVG